MLFSGLLVVALAAAAPAFVRARALMRGGPPLFETHGASNDVRY